MRVCVYCSSSSAIDEAYAVSARELGSLLGQRDHTLVYGGANVGTMGVLAEAAHAAGAHVIGIIPRRFVDYGLAYDGVDELIVTETMSERKAAMEESADAFVALPGGFGTLEELFQALTLKQLGQLAGPIVLLNTHGFYEHLIAHIDAVFRHRFAKEEFRGMLAIPNNAQEAMSLIENHAATLLPRKWN